jgi:hypothetical protein
MGMRQYASSAEDTGRFSRRHNVDCGSRHDLCSTTPVYQVDKTNMPMER